MKHLITSIICLLACIRLSGTSIVPFENLGAAALASSNIYTAIAGPIDTIQINGEIRMTQSFEISSIIKGQELQEFNITKFSRWTGNLFMAVAGEFNFIVGKEYLLFLQGLNTKTEYYPTCSSYYIYEIEKLENTTYAIPKYENGSLHIALDPTDNQKAHQVFDLKKLNNLLKKHLQQKSNWNQTTAVAPSAIKQQIITNYKNNPPSYCGYISDGSTPNAARWRNMETQTLPVYYQLNGDGCSNIDGEIQNTINYLNNGYPGVNLANPISTSGYSNCSGGRAYNGLPNYLSNTYGDRRRVYIQFSDPCNEIPALRNCGGTLGYGGAYWGGTYTANGVTYSQASTGFVVINESVTSCYCGNVGSGNNQTSFVLFLAHELTHVLGLNHISAGAGSALINPSCCNEISSLDLACIGHLYQDSGPQCTHSTRTYNNTSIGSQQVLANNQVRTFNSVSINSGANVIWKAENNVEINGPFVIPIGSTLTTSIDECN